MSKKKKSVEPMLIVTNPVWLSLFRHSIEDPHWGQLVTSQVAIGSAIHDAAEALTDATAREAIQKIAAQVVQTSAASLGSSTKRSRTPKGR